MARINITGDLGNTQSSSGVRHLRIDESAPSRPYTAKGGDGIFNIRDDFRWTLSPSSSRKDVPYMKLVEWDPRANSVLNKIFTFVSQGASAFATGSLLDPRVSSPIAGSFIAEPTGIEYHFPAIGLGDFTEQVGNEYGFGDSGSPISNIASTIGNVFQLKAGYHATGIKDAIGGALLAEIPTLAKTGASLLYGTIEPSNVQFFTRTGLQSHTFTIDLLNTVSEEEVAANRELIKILMYQNTFEKTNFIVSRAPCLYSMEIVGRKWLPAVFITPSIQNLGTFLNIGGIPTPEAFRITLAINELIPQMRVVTAAYDDNQEKLPAFLRPSEVCKAIEQIGSDVTSGLANIGLA